MDDRSVLGEELQPCGMDPVTGFYRDGCCRTGLDDRGSHTICAVVTAEFLDHQRSIGNDLSTPVPQYGFPGLVPGDRWCVTAANWLRAHEDGAAAYVVLASTHERALDIVPLDALEEHAVDVPADPGPFGDWATPVRLIVVGAGVAGLTVAGAATEVGAEVVVLEARDRIGGRTWTAPFGPGAIDLGAAWVHGPSGTPWQSCSQHRDRDTERRCLFLANGGVG